MKAVIEIVLLKAARDPNIVSLLRMKAATFRTLCHVILPS